MPSLRCLCARWETALTHRRRPNGRGGVPQEIMDAINNPPKLPRRPPYAKLLAEILAESAREKTLENELRGMPKPKPAFLDSLLHSDPDEYGFD